MLGPAVLAACAGLLVFAGSAFAGAITPESGGSRNADEIHSLYTITLAVAVVVFVGVISALVYSLVKFRVRKNPHPAQIHGNTRLEIGFALSAAAILIVLTVVTFAKLPSIQNPPPSDPEGLPVAGGAQLASTNPPKVPGGRRLLVRVNGQQYIWRFTYGQGLGAPFAYEAMVVPTKTTVVLAITSTDVNHSWWIPKLGGKFDAVPGYVNYTWFKIDKPGTFRGQCAELCGRQHANMLARVTAVPVAEYQAWIETRKREITQANRDAAKDPPATPQQR